MWINKKLCVMGLGYIGLPTAVMFANHGLKVHGVDVNPRVVESLRNKQLHIEEPGLKDMMVDVMDRGSLTVATEPEIADAYIIAVPTPINDDKTANLDYVRSAAEMILPYLRKDVLVILESTVPPRTVEDVLIPILSKSGLRIGDQIYVSHSPERVLPGKLFEELVHNDRVVGGINERSSEMTAELYKLFVKGNIHITDATTAEMVKLMENTYRDVNIALANEFAMIAEKLGFDVWEAIELANYHPRVNIHRSGPGVGGHCIAVDPWFIYEKASTEAKLIHLSRMINDNMPEYVVNKVRGILTDISMKVDIPKIAVLGLAFKGNIDDMRESPSLKVIDLLRTQNVNVVVYDPHVKSHIEGKVDSLEEVLDSADLMLLLTDHDEFRNIDIKLAANLMRHKQIVDTRKIINPTDWRNVGFIVNQLGNCYTGQITVEV
jgi:UDP-N-acetyl-D-mannosaminuronic acid dehydrogenase